MNQRETEHERFNLKLNSREIVIYKTCWTTKCMHCEQPKGKEQGTQDCRHRLVSEVVLISEDQRYRFSVAASERVV